ncbi:MAG: hypothetical protein K2N35_08585 [Muribaculaceae bacterium]|nr:hypothetical protein [Muribaculaceae bacterium]
MMGLRTGILMVAMIAFAATSYGEYSLKIKRGKYPEDVKIENINGNIPESAYYKNGWTEEGWSAGDYGKVTNIALSPSCVIEGVCENALTLPSMLIEDGEWLSWDGCEIYPVFNERYTVEFRANGKDVWEKLGEYTETKSTWTTHMIDLSPYAGMDGQVRFVCRSEKGYMLGLNNIAIKRPTEHTFYSINTTPKFFSKGELNDGNVLAEINIMNTGAALSSAVIGISIDGTRVSAIQEENYWPTGETRRVEIPLPLTPNEKAEYEVTIEPEGAEMQVINNSFAYCTSMKRYLYVDKGTGMWCNACPNGTLEIEKLEEAYGEALIVGETHYGETTSYVDLLANNLNIEWLKFYSIPQLMLNHVASTKGEKTTKFEDQICLPTEMEIKITDMSVNKDGSLCAKAEVGTSESFADSDRRYTIGYILTRNVTGNENAQYYQNNICTTALQMQYRYLPSRMLYPICFFPNVTIPSQLATGSENPAFTGIEGSLPASLEAGMTYTCSLEIPCPEGFDNFDGMRLVAYIIDAGKKTIINSTASYIDDSTGVEEIADSYIGSKTEKIFTIDGRQVGLERESLLPGLYIIEGKKILIK